MPQVYVSIGSNVGRERNIRGGVRALVERFGGIVLSSVYQTPAEGFDGDDFYNLVARFETEEPIEAVREALSAIEGRHGRTRNHVRYGPRTLDIDILLYGDLIRREGRFDVPRREIVERAYVLCPLAELAPAGRHPETGECFADLWRRCPDQQGLRKVDLDLLPAAAANRPTR